MKTVMECKEKGFQQRVGPSEMMVRTTVLRQLGGQGLSAGGIWDTYSTHALKY
jgi:hypothetical protein